MKTVAAAGLTAISLAITPGCGNSQDKYLQRENELADWGDQIEIELTPAKDGDPCVYYTSNVRVGLGLKLTADVSADCDES